MTPQSFRVGQREIKVYVCMWGEVGWGGWSVGVGGRSQGSVFQNGKPMKRAHTGIRAFIQHNKTLNRYKTVTSGPRPSVNTMDRSHGKKKEKKKEHHICFTL